MDGCTIHTVQKEIGMDRSVILDAGATFSSFKTKELTMDIKAKKQGTRMATDMGTHTIVNMGKVLGHQGKIWHNPNSVVNAFSFSQPTENAHVTCNNEKEDAFAVEMNGKKVKFPRSEDGPCFHEFPKTHEPPVDAVEQSAPTAPVLVSTIEENIEGFLVNQVQ